MDNNPNKVARSHDEAANAPLLSQDFSNRLASEWSSVQASFVDEPRRAVQRADELVATAIKNLADTFAQERSRLESQWDKDGDVSTEQLRVALTRYRSFFHRLLSI
jgi:hypothetical protein